MQFLMRGEYLKCLPSRWIKDRLETEHNVKIYVSILETACPLLFGENFDMVPSSGTC